MISEALMQPSMQPLIQALDEQMHAGVRTQFWLRDDDAVEPTAQLDRLLSLTSQHHIPLMLAVIPAGTGQALSERLASTEQVSVAIHGWSHSNYAPAGEKKQELGDHRSTQTVLDELASGLSQLTRLHRSRVVPVLVPPWNRISPSVAQGLSAIGFQGLSTFGAKQFESITTLNTHVDVIDWKGTRGGRNPEELVVELTARVHDTQGPIGVLTHHLVHDEQAWAFLQSLFALVTGHAGCNWVPISSLLARSPDP